MLLYRHLATPIFYRFNIILLFNFSGLKEKVSGGDQLNERAAERDQLDEGDSGSIVYFVGDKKDGKHQHFPWGMLVEKEDVPRGGNEENYQIYYAVVLDQVFQDIQADYQHMFNNIKLFSVSRD